MIHAGLGKHFHGRAGKIPPKLSHSKVRLSARAVAGVPVRGRCPPRAVAAGSPLPLLGKKGLQNLSRGYCVEEMPFPGSGQPSLLELTFGLETTQTFILEGNRDVQ